MSKKRKSAHLLVLIVVFILMLSFTAFADDATLDILDAPRFQGAITWVNAIGKWVDQWFAAFISFVSFFIISASCLRNVLAGAYCVFPKFWDKVDEAHKAMESISIASIQSAFSGDAWKNTVSTGSISQFLMRCLPNIKVLTDFEDAQDPDYKQYFMRAIPQCVMAVFVGVFIYNGLYRDVMKVTSSFGSKMVSQAISSIKPEDVLYKLTNISGIPPYPVKGATTGTDHIADVIVQEVYGHILNEYTDQNEKKHKTNMFQSLSNKAVEISGNYAGYADADTWTVKATNSGVSVGTVPQLPGEYIAQDGMKYEGSFYFDVNELGLTTEYHKGESVYIYVTLSFTNNGASEKGLSANALTDLTYVIDTSQMSAGKLTYKNANSTGGSFQTGTTVRIGDKWDVSVGSSTLEFKSYDNITYNTPYTVTNLNYGSDSTFYSVKYVVFKNGGGCKLQSPSMGLTITPGDSIGTAYNKLKNNSQTTGTSATTAAADDSDDLDPDD